LRKRDSRIGSLAGLTDQDIKDVFTETQAARHKRAEEIVSSAHLYQSLMAYEKPLLSTLILDGFGRFRDFEAVLTRTAVQVSGSSRLEQLPIKHRPRAIPFVDELPARPLGKATPVRTIFAILNACLLLIAIRPHYRPISASELLNSTQPLSFDTTGTAALNSLIDQHVSCPSVAAGTVEQAVRLLYSSTQLLAPVLIYIVEGYRAGNSGTFLAVPSMFLAGACYAGFGPIATIYSILSAFLAYESPTGRFILHEAASSMAPALALGYVLPVVLMALQTLNVGSWKTGTTVWQFAPVLVCALTYFIGPLLRLRKESGKSEEDKKQAILDRYRAPDVPILKRTYSYAFTLQATAHLALLIYLSRHPEVSVTSILFSLASPSRVGQGISGIRPDLDFVYTHDMAIAAASWLLSNLYAVWNLRRLGYIRTPNMVLPMLGAVVGQAVAGPGATWIALWSWRENVLSRWRRA
jgi:hypothetical protein